MRCSVSNCGNCHTDRILLFSASHIRLMVTIHSREAKYEKVEKLVVEEVDRLMEEGEIVEVGRVGGVEGNEVGE